MRHQRKGSKAVEFALTLPIYLVLLAGIVDFGWYFNQRMIVTMAARDGARAGSLVTIVSHDDPIAVCEAQAQASLAEADIVGEATCIPEGERPDARIRCIVDAGYSGLVGFAPLPDLQHSEIIMRMAEQP